MSMPRAFPYWRLIMRLTKDSARTPDRQDVESLHSPATRRGDRMKRRKFVLCLLLPFCGCVVAQPAPAPAPSNAPLTMVTTIVSGERQRIDFISVLNPDCTTAGYVTVRIITPPVHGELTTERGLEYTSYPKIISVINVM